MTGCGWLLFSAFSLNILRKLISFQGISDTLKALFDFYDIYCRSENNHGELTITWNRYLHLFLSKTEVGGSQWEWFMTLIK